MAARPALRPRLGQRQRHAGALALPAFGLEVELLQGAFDMALAETAARSDGVDARVGSRQSAVCANALSRRGSRVRVAARGPQAALCGLGGEVTAELCPRETPSVCLKLYGHKPHAPVRSSSDPPDDQNRRTAVASTRAPRRDRRATEAAARGRIPVKDQDKQQPRPLGVLEVPAALRVLAAVVRTGLRSTRRKSSARLVVRFPSFFVG